MANVLVIGGTRFFGKNLVELLLERGNKVTLLTRGQTSDPFGDGIQRLVADRTDEAALRQAVGDKHYDVVFDNICYTPQEAQAACRIFGGKTERYIVTSSLSVYPFQSEPLHEHDVDTLHMAINDDPEASFDYAEGKRQVEAVFLQQTRFAAAAVRFPIVLGPNDYTKRLHFHVGRVLRGEPIIIPNPDVCMNFIHEEEAARFLYWLGLDRELTGAINARSEEEITLVALINEIERQTGCRAIVQSKGEESNQSPFGVPDSWVMDTSLAFREGFRFYRLSEWLPELISYVAAEEKGEQ
ncbi:NAD-dependent epimerase/dehydratase family protein [Paenibacillus campi]|uniref:NAD-dependent epimerase/dehydratase family protein n=1 Tax=Paenibacillus campi TaxID=3106031 RepID=UPI002AFFD33F|nr:NAD-dependent epimerase/dehydratase family protein [Paenibacillus sp. SGZ-1014]